MWGSGAPGAVLMQEAGKVVSRAARNKMPFVTDPSVLRATLASANADRALVLRSRLRARIEAIREALSREGYGLFSRQERNQFRKLLANQQARMAKLSPYSSSGGYPDMREINAGLLADSGRTDLAEGLKGNSPGIVPQQVWSKAYTPYLEEKYTTRTLLPELQRQRKSGVLPAWTT
jgi:hypothetical protein